MLGEEKASVMITDDAAPRGYDILELVRARGGDGWRKRDLEV